jgi:predicted nucleic acid-binding protein
MFLLDTNVVSELSKLLSGRANANVAAWSQGVPLASLFLSVVVIQELEIGVLMAERRNAEKGAALRSWLEGQVLRVFADRILAVDLAVARHAARLQVPKTRPERDTLIAATALVHGLTMVTRNVADFEPTGVPLVNPWLRPTS